VAHKGAVAVAELVRVLGMPSGFTNQALKTRVVAILLLCKGATTRVFEPVGSSATATAPFGATEVLTTIIDSLLYKPHNRDVL
jgi:hypothetical protein